MSLLQRTRVGSDRTGCEADWCALGAAGTHGNPNTLPQACRPRLSRVHWSYICLDEGHRLKNAACKLNAELRTYRADHRLLLTGGRGSSHCTIHERCRSKVHQRLDP